MKLLSTIALAGCAVSAAPTSVSSSPVTPAPSPHAVATPMPPGMSAPRAEQLDGKRRRLVIALPGPIREAFDGTRLLRLAVGADIGLSVPAVLGTGHGPFTRIYPGPGSITAKASSDAVTVKLLEARSDEDARIQIRCHRAEVVELAVDVTDAAGNHVQDAIDLGCVTPTRLAVTESTSSTGPYLARAGTIRVDFTWFGRLADGREVELIGALPVAVAPGETAIARLDDGAFSALHAATSVAWTSSGLVATMPIAIEDPSTFRLDVDMTPHRQRGRAIVAARASALDDQGRSFVGLAGCSVTTVERGVMSRPENRCAVSVITGTNPPPSSPRTVRADTVCFTVLGRQACKAVPE